MRLQVFRVVLLLLAAFAVLMVSLGYGARLAGMRNGWPPPGRTTRRIGRTALALLGLGLGCFAYGLFIEADWVQVTRLTVTTNKWPSGKALRVAHVSDLHVDRESRALDRITEVLAAEQVDLIVFTGDSLNSAAALPIFRSTFGGWPARLGRFAVRGNHDVYRWGQLDLFGGGVATELMTDVPLLLDGGRLAICGAPFRALDGVENCLQKSPPGAFALFAYHSPDLIEVMPAPVDLFLAGHTHGGQVALPFYGALVTMSVLDKRYEAGRYQVGPTTLYVNRGVGFEPNFPRVRFFARPELTLIDVVGTGAPSPATR